MSHRVRIRPAALLLLPTGFLALFLAALVGALFRALTDLRYPTDLALGLATIAVQLVTICGLLCWLLLRKLVQALAMREFNRRGPWLREQLAVYALGLPIDTPPSFLYRRYPRAFEQCLLEFLPSLTGPQRDRLRELATALELPNKWRRQYRGLATLWRKAHPELLASIGMVDPETTLLAGFLKGRVEAFRREAARAAAASGDPALIREALGVALQDSLLTRIVVGEGLKPQAAMLAAVVIPSLLNTLPVAQLCSLLDMIYAWQRSLHFAGLGQLIHSADPRVRTRCLALLPYAQLDDDLRDALANALNDPDNEVRASAFNAVARLGLPVAPVVATGLSAANPELRLAAAFSLARLGPTGSTLLEAAVRGGAQGSAQALEALEKLRLGRLAGWRV